MTSAPGSPLPSTAIDGKFGAVLVEQAQDTRVMGRIRPAEADDLAIESALQNS